MGLGEDQILDSIETTIAQLDTSLMKMINFTQITLTLYHLYFLVDRCIPKLKSQSGQLVVDYAGPRGNFERTETSQWKGTEHERYLEG